jgi:hypothetical protein
VTLLPLPHNKAEFNALYRAAHQLETQGKIMFHYFQYFEPKVFITLPHQEIGTDAYNTMTIGRDADPDIKRYEKWYRGTRSAGGRAKGGTRNKLTFAESQASKRAKRLSVSECTGVSTSKQLTSDAIEAEWGRA